MGFLGNGIFIQITASRTDPSKQAYVDVYSIVISFQVAMTGSSHDDIHTSSDCASSSPCIEQANSQSSVLPTVDSIHTKSALSHLRAASTQHTADSSTTPQFRLRSFPRPAFPTFSPKSSPPSILPHQNSTPLDPVTSASIHSPHMTGIGQISLNDKTTPSDPPSRAFSAEEDDSLTFLQQMICGGLAGITEHVSIFPIDTVKTRMQSYVGIRDSPNAGMLHTTRAIVAGDGVRALWRGVSAVLLSAGPAHALYFATYENVCQYLMRRSWSNSTERSKNPLATSLAGASATVVCDGVMTPLDVVKQRMQLASRGAYAGAYACTKHVYVNHGFRAFFAGYKATLLMNVPFTAVHFTGYEMAKQAILNWRGIDSSQYSASSHCAAGACAGAVAAAASNPLDVVKTRLQTQGEIGARRYRGVLDTLRSIRVEEGPAGFLRGIRARVLFHIPAAAISWTTYEFFKHVLKTTGLDRDSPANSAYT